MKYKVGDRVRIKSLDWYHENKDKDGNIPLNMNTNSKYNFIKIMIGLCGKVMTISRINIYSYNMVEDNGEYFWTDEMIECKMEEETYDFLKTDKPYPTKPKVEDFLDMFNDTITLPEGFIFRDQNGNIIDATKIVLEKKKKEYPKTFKECQDYLEEDVAPVVEPVSKTNRRRLVHLLEILLVCRDAYWKLYGEEMGLGKPWKPDYDSGVDKFGIICLDGVVQESNPTTNWERHLNKILDFPIREMRDAFYENFKELIEQCKELL